MAVTHFKVAPTVTVPGTPYVQFDVVGGRLTFTGLRGGRLRAVTVTDAAKQSTVDYLLVLFESAPTTIADNATYNIADADLPKIVYQQPMLSGPFTSQALSTNSYHYVYELDVPIWSAGGTVYGFLIITSGIVPTYAAVTDVSVNLFVEMG